MSDPAQSLPLKFAVIPAQPAPARDRAIAAIAQEFRRRGLEQVTDVKSASFVLNPADLESPEPFLRHAQALFCASVAALGRRVPDVRAVAYPALVRTLSNIMVAVADVPGRAEPEVYFTTPEAGFYHYPFDAGRVCDSLMPIVSARLVIHNRLAVNLPEQFWQTTPVVEQIKTYCHELDKLGVLPAPFPLREVLAPAEIAHLYQVFEMTGLSYGNLSARERLDGLGPTTFWMSARGVDKSRLQTIGRDILLVTGYNEPAGEILVSVPPEHNPKARASVDAIEHCLIYEAHPEVGAIVHVHAWMDGIAVTSQNHPCGTINIARSVAELLDREPDPAHAVIGLKNHGLTITGPDLADIFSRIRGRLKTEVPMLE
jgi:ribulose-5-phosphate 4-epimerase/fuculose-1-phosphate aldolase